MQEDLGQSYTHLMHSIEVFEASVAADIRIAKERWQAKKMRRCGFRLHPSVLGLGPDVPTLERHVVAVHCFSLPSPI
jgi:hypothetical protein